MDSDCLSVTSTQLDEDPTQLSVSTTDYAAAVDTSPSDESNSMSKSGSETSTAIDASSNEQNAGDSMHTPRRNGSRQRGRKFGPIRSFNPHKSFMSAVTPPVVPFAGVVRTPMMIGNFGLRGRLNRSNRSTPSRGSGLRRPRSPALPEDYPVGNSHSRESPFETIFLSPSDMTQMKPFASDGKRGGRDSLPRFTQDESKTGSLSYPLIYLSPAGSVVIVLRPDLIIETTADHSIRVVNHGKFSAYVGGRGQTSSIVHPSVRIIHTANSVCGRFTSTNDKLVIIGNAGVLFTMDHLREAYLLDSDYTLLQFYQDSQTGTVFIPQCMEMVDTAIYDRRQDGSLLMQINGMSIRHSTNGDFVIDARPRHISFTEGNIHVRTSHIDMGIQSTETAYVKYGAKRVHVSVSGMVVSDGSSCTSMDHFGRIIACT